MRELIAEMDSVPWWFVFVIGFWLGTFVMGFVLTSQWYESWYERWRRRRGANR